VISVLTGIAAELSQEEPYRSAVLAPLEVLGVDKLADSGAVVKARFKTIPNQQWMVGREMNRRIIKRFDEAKIEMPSAAPTVKVVLPATTTEPRASSTPGDDRKSCTGEHRLGEDPTGGA